MKILLINVIEGLLAPPRMIGVDMPQTENFYIYTVLALKIELALHDVISVLLDLDGSLAKQIANSELDDTTMAVSDRNVIASIYRLLSIMKEPVQRAFMGKHIKREIIFFILCGSCGREFLQSIINVHQAGEIYEINSWIKENFRSSFTVEELAEK